MIEIKAETNEILLSGIVGDGWDEFPITQKGVVDALRSFGSSPVTIRINSPGGAADEGIGIYNALRSHGGEVTTINDSLAASAASVIFLAGKNRLMADGSRIMIHRAMAFAMGNQDELGKVISALKSYDASLVDIYRQHMNGTEASLIETMMADETWFVVDEAINWGLATGRVENGKKYKKPKNAFDSAAALLRRAKMAQFSKHLTSPGQ
jgi:ATP-dependent protease ClpP protease subunit